MSSPTTRVPSWRLLTGGRIDDHVHEDRAAEGMAQHEGIVDRRRQRGLGVERALDQRDRHILGHLFLGLGLDEAEGVGAVVVEADGLGVLVDSPGQRLVVGAGVEGVVEGVAYRIGEFVAVKQPLCDSQYGDVVAAEDLDRHPIGHRHQDFRDVVATVRLDGLEADVAVGLVDAGGERVARDGGDRLDGVYAVAEVPVEPIRVAVMPYDNVEPSEPGKQRSGGRGTAVGLIAVQRI